MEIRRPAGAASPADGGGLVAVDATSAAGGLRVDPTQFDAYYFAPQKCFASDGGLWLALLLPGRARADRAHRRLRALGAGLPRPQDRPRQLPPGPDLQHPGPGHPAPAGRAGRVDAGRRRARVDGRALRPLGRDPLHLGRAVGLRPALRGASPADRSHVVGTIDFVDAVDAAAVAKVLRANGIVDTEPYRKLGRNQLRIAMFPAIDPDDVAALCACINYVVGASPPDPRPNVTTRRPHLVLVHGLGSAASFWDNLRPALEDGVPGDRRRPAGPRAPTPSGRRRPEAHPRAMAAAVADQLADLQDRAAARRGPVPRRLGGAGDGGRRAGRPAWWPLAPAGLWREAGGHPAGAGRDNPCHHWLPLVDPVLPLLTRLPFVKQLGLRRQRARPRRRHRASSSWPRPGPWARPRATRSATGPPSITASRARRRSTCPSPSPSGTPTAFCPPTPVRSDRSSRPPPSG